MVLVAISRMKSLLLYPAFSLLPSPKLSNFKPSHPPPYFFPSASAFRGSSSLTVNPGLLPQVRPSMPCTDPHGPLNFIRGYCSRAQGSLSRPLTPTGEIHVIVGPMFAGKTTALLRRIQLERRNGRSVAMIKSNKDARYGLDSIVTHDGVKYPCFPLADLSSFKSNVGHRAYDELDVIGIDEAQFFGDLYEFCQVAADHDGKTVIVAGLDGDYLRRSFGSVLHIIPLADSVSKLTARCELCGKPAHFTLRKIDDTKTELIGGAEVYMPVCRQHYASGQVVMEATRMVLQNKANSPCLTGD